MLLSRKVAIAASVASLVASSMVFAAPTEAPPAFVKRISDQLATQLNKNRAQLNNPAVLNRIVSVYIEPYVDEQGFGTLVMGQYVKSSTPAQRALFTRNFRNSIVKTYTKELANYSNQSYSIRPYRNTGSQYPVVQIDFKTASGSKIPMAFQLTDKNNQWKIRNINVNGIDLAATFRDQFKATVQSNGGNIDKAIASFKPNTSAVENKLKK